MLPTNTFRTPLCLSPVKKKKKKVYTYLSLFPRHFHTRGYASQASSTRTPPPDLTLLYIMWPSLATPRVSSYCIVQVVYLCKVFSSVSSVVVLRLAIFKCFEFLEFLN